MSGSLWGFQDLTEPPQKLCLRQNQISHIEIPNPPAATLLDLDLYDNLISHVKGLDHLLQLRILDLSFNKIKHIKNINHLEQLTDLFFVQNRIQRIEGLKGLTRIRNLELAANRIRVYSGLHSWFEKVVLLKKHSGD